jgi:hypothetical protein
MRPGRPSAARRSKPANTPNSRVSPTSQKHMCNKKKVSAENRTLVVPFKFTSFAADLFW